MRAGLNQGSLREGQGSGRCKIPGLGGRGSEVTLIAKVPDPKTPKPWDAFADSWLWMYRGKTEPRGKGSRSPSRAM